MEADILPLCGNIPIKPDAPLPEPIAAFRQTGKTWLGLFFGGLYREWKPEPFFSQLARAAHTAGRSVGLVQVGNAGGEGDEIWSEIERDYASTFRFFTLGPAARVRPFPRSCSPPISASPPRPGASSARAARPRPCSTTACPSSSPATISSPRVRAAQPPTPIPLVHRAGDELENDLVAGLIRRLPCASAPEIAAQLLHDMAAPAASRP